MEFEEKFIVINKKRFVELSDAVGWEYPIGAKLHCQTVCDFIDALDEFAVIYKEETGKLLDQQYLVVNRDEPYANEIWEIIKRGEAEKEVKP